MNQYIETACAQCQHPLRVRREYLGRRIACKFCNHVFEAREEPAPAILSAAAPPAAAEFPDLRPRVAELEQELDQARAEVAVAIEEQKMASFRLQQAQDELGEEHAARKELHQSQEDLRQRLETSEQDRDAARQQVETLEKELDRHREEIAGHVEAHAGLQTGAAQLMQELDRTRKQRNSAARDGQELRSQIKVLERSLAEARQQWETERAGLLAQAEKNHQEQMSDVTAQLRAEQARAEALRQERDDALQRAQTLEEFLLRLREAADGHRELQDRLQSEVTLLNQGLEQTCRQRDAARQRAEALEQEATEANRNVQELTAHAEALQVELEQLRQRDVAWRQELESARAAVHEPLPDQEEFSLQRHNLEAELSRSRHEIALLQDMLQNFGIFMDNPK